MASRTKRLCSSRASAMLVLALVSGMSRAAHATVTEPEDPLARHRTPLELPSPPAEPPPPPPPPEPPRPPGPVDLLPPLSLARVAGIELPPRPTASTPEGRAEERTERFLRRALRRDALESGRVDGYFHDLGRAIRSELHVDPRGVQEDIFRGASVPEALARELGRYGAFSRPIEPRGSPLPEASRRTMDADEVALDERFDFQNLLNGHVTWYRAVVRVMQNRSGEIFDAQLLRSSGLPTVDSAALEAVRRAVLDDPPPARVLEGRETIWSDWAIEVGDVATDPSQVGSVMDGGGVALGCTEGGCAGGGRGILRFRFELLDVVDGMHPADPPEPDDADATP